MYVCMFVRLLDVCEIGVVERGNTILREGRREGGREGARERKRERGIEDKALIRSIS